MDTWGKPRKETSFLIPITIHSLVCVLLSLKGEGKYKFHSFQKLLNTPVGKKQIFAREASWHKPAFLFKSFKRKQ